MLPPRRHRRLLSETREHVGVHLQCRPGQSYSCSISASLLDNITDLAAALHRLVIFLHRSPPAAFAGGSVFLSRRRRTPVICLCVETLEFRPHHSSPISVPVAATLPVLSGSAFMRTRSVGIEQIAVFVSTATVKDGYYLFGMTHTRTHTHPVRCVVGIVLLLPWKSLLNS